MKKAPGKGAFSVLLRGKLYAGAKITDMVLPCMVG